MTTPVLEKPGGVSNFCAMVGEFTSCDLEYARVGSPVGKESRVGALRRVVRDYATFRDMIDEGHFEIVHLNPSLAPKAVLRDGLLCRAAKAAGKAVIVFFHGWDTQFEKRLSGWKLRLFQHAYFQADAILVLAERFKEKLREWGYKGPVHVETTAFDSRMLSGFDSRARLEQRHPTLNLLFASRLVREKGVYEVLHTYEILRRKGLPVSLTVAGEGPERAPAQRQVAERGIAGADFTGYVGGSKKVSVFMEADIFLFPTDYGEGMPVCVVEAMAFGLPVVTRPAGGIGDFFEDGRMGFLTRSRDPHVLADLVERLVQNRELRIRMARFNMHYAHERFEAARVVARLERLYGAYCTGRKS